MKTIFCYGILEDLVQFKVQHNTVGNDKTWSNLTGLGNIPLKFDTRILIKSNSGRKIYFCLVQVPFVCHITHLLKIVGYIQCMRIEQ